MRSKLPFHLLSIKTTFVGLPWCLSGKESAYQCRSLTFDPCVRKIPWRRKWQPTPVLLLGKMPWTRGAWRATAWGCKKVRHDLVAKTATVFVLSYCDCWVSLNAFEVLVFTNHEDVPLWTPVAHQSRYHLFCASVLMPPFVFIMTFYLNRILWQIFYVHPHFSKETVRWSSQLQSEGQGVHLQSCHAWLHHAKICSLWTRHCGGCWGSLPTGGLACISPLSWELVIVYLISLCGETFQLFLL